jgi:hypothetical protein
MAEQLQPMPVNPGDPITSELLSNIVSNINIINSLSNSLNDANPGGGGDDKDAPRVTEIESGREKVPCNTSNTGKLAIKFKKSFTARPNVVCSIWQPSTADFVKDKYLPVVTSVSTSEFTVQMLSAGATANGTIWVHWIACN